MEQAKSNTDPDVWVQYQELSQLSEEQQRALIALAQKSSLQETENLLLASQAVAQSSAIVIEGLGRAKEARAATGAKILRMFRIFDTDIKLSSDITSLTAEKILERLYAVSTLEQKAIEEMLAQAPQAKTKELEELINRFRKIQEQVTKFTALIESQKTTREKEQKDAEQKSAAAVAALQKEDTKPAEGSCILC